MSGKQEDTYNAYEPICIFPKINFFSKTTPTPQTTSISLSRLFSKQLDLTVEDVLKTTPTAKSRLLYDTDVPIFRNILDS